MPEYHSQCSYKLFMHLEVLLVINQIPEVCSDHRINITNQMGKSLQLNTKKKKKIPLVYDIKQPQ